MLTILSPNLVQAWTYQLDGKLFKSKESGIIQFLVYSRISKKLFWTKVKCGLLEFMHGMQDPGSFWFTQIPFNSININCASTKCRNCVRC